MLIPKPLLFLSLSRSSFLTSLPATLLAFFFVVLSLLSGCQNEEVITPRRRADADSNDQNTFNGEFEATLASLEPCPNGSGAQLTADFAQVSLGLKIPETDMNLASSDLLAEINTNLQEEGSPTMNNQTGTFEGSFMAADTENAFDVDTCLLVGDSYASSLRITITGTVIQNSISNASYEVFNICTGGADTNSICSGSFSGTR